MTSLVLPDVSTEQKRLLVSRELALRSFRHFLAWVVTETDDGFQAPVPIALAGGFDPLRRQIEAGEIQPRRGEWSHLLELADDWGSGRSTLNLKSRQMLFTWMVSAYAVFVGQQRGNVFVLSQGQDYADAVIDRCRFIWDRLPRELRLPLDKNNTRMLSFKGAGSIQSFPSTEDAVRSLSGRLVIVDEAAFHKAAQANYRAYRPSIAGSGGQLIMISTANGPHGFFHSQFEAARRGESDYDWRFYPWTARLDHDRAWYEREKRAYPGFQADFLRENPTTVDEAFSSLAGVVYPDWNPQVHIAPPRVPYELCKLRVAGVDFGGSPGNPNAVVILGLDKDDHVHQYDEMAVPGVLSLDEIGGFIARWKARAPLISVECDHDQVAIATLVRQFRLPARKANKTRGEGLEVTEWLLKNNRLTIDPGCVRSIEEFYGYRWRESLDPNTKERYQTATPVDHHGDLMDARRYALMRLLVYLRQGLTIQSLNGRPLATKAV